ncbi:MAG: hypothetical protein ABII90_05515 [Bacteroidota bacterium]
MKERMATETMKQKIFITLLFSCIAFICFSYKTNAQGWSFSFQLAQSGPCGGVIPYTIPTLPNFGIPTKSQCESLRQQILAIKQSYPVYDGNNYIGDCSLYYTCTPCTGSDIITPGQVNPGDVSFNGQFEGKPFFTPHESAAFQDWATDYKQLLASYGITSILGKNITPHQTSSTKPKAPEPKPSSGNKDVDEAYKNKYKEFVSSGGNTSVDLSGKKGVVQLLTTAEEQAKRDKWMNDQGFENLKKIPENGLPELDPIGDLEPAPFWTSDEMIDLGLDALKFTAAFVSGGLGYAAVVSIDVAKGVIKGNSTQEIIVDVAGDLTVKKLGSVVKTGIGNIYGEGVKADYEVMKQAGSSLIDTWKLYNN